MTVFVPIMMFGWALLTLALFATTKSWKAVVVSLIFGWLFLPEAQYNIPGLPNYTKITAVCFPILLGTFFYDSRRFKRLYPSKLDIPIIIWCCCPLVSSINNGLGIYDGISDVLGQIFTWGFPYIIGKMYFSDRRKLRDLAVWIVIGGLVYVPFCVWEMRMAPTLHYYIYGFRTDRFIHTIRFGGYRPTVFLRHGLAVGLWMMSSLLMGIWLWRTKSLRVLWGLPMGLMVSILFVITVLCRSLNAIVLLAVGIFAYFLIRSWRWKFIIIGLVLIPLAYIVFRRFGILSSDRLTAIASYIDDARAHSLFIRLFNEERLVERALERPLFGWGGWGRNRIFDIYGQDTSITDGLWIIVFGIYGMVGLVSLGLVLLLPAVVFWRKYRLADWGHPNLAPVAGLVCIILLFVIDCLMNAFVNPVFIVAAGGILGWLNKADDIQLIVYNEHRIQERIWR